MKQFFLSQEAESSMAADLMASRGYGEGLRSTPGYVRENVESPD
jgi:hypothetical protein